MPSTGSSSVRATAMRHGRRRHRWASCGLCTKAEQHCTSAATARVQIVGDLHVSGDVYDRQGSLARLRGHYDVHTHGGLGSPPNPQD